LSKASESFGSFEFLVKSTGYAGGYHEILLSKASESFGSFEFLVKSTGYAGGYHEILLSKALESFGSFEFWLSQLVTPEAIAKFYCQQWKEQQIKNKNQ
jgi:hypothetical protein